VLLAVTSTALAALGYTWQPGAGQAWRWPELRRVRLRPRCLCLAPVPVGEPAQPQRNGAPHHRRRRAAHAPLRPNPGPGHADVAELDLSSGQTLTWTITNPEMDGGRATFAW